MYSLTIEFVVYDFNRLYYVLYLVFLYPLIEPTQLKYLLPPILPPPTVVVPEQLSPVLLLEHPVYHVTAKQLQLYLHLQVVVFDALVRLVEGVTNHQSVLLFVVLERAGGFPAVRLPQLRDPTSSQILG